MNRMINLRIPFIAVAGMLVSLYAHAQNIDAERMKRDIEVAENVLATLIKQELENQQTFFGIDITGTYQPGYGVTFRVPSEHSVPIAMTITSDEFNYGATVISDGNGRLQLRRPRTPDAPKDTNAMTLADELLKKREIVEDSLRVMYNSRIIRAAQNFILDYGDFVSQLRPDERIVVTNQSDRNMFYFRAGKRSRISVEGQRRDITAFRQGQLTREQAIKKLTVVNTETIETREADLEMLSSIFSRLYRPDLSKTYFTEGNVYYERLRDFGAVFYMRVVSSSETGFGRYTLPTAGLENVEQATRDKKVSELYPIFENEIKDNIVEYGRTVKSLGDNESLVFNIALTRCKGCGIPESLELSVKASVLKEFAAGKIDKNAAVRKISIKKGANQ